MIKKIINISPGFFRLFLAIVVLVVHSVGFLTIGHAAVFIFFILSGYWIFRMFHEKYSKFHNPYKTYIKSRFLRIYPIYWFILIFAIILYSIVPGTRGNVFCCPHGNLWENLVANFILISRNIRGDGLYIGTAWSLDVELQFYILAPLLILLFKKKGLALVVTIATIILITLLAFTAPFILEYDTLLTYIPFFLIGGIIYFNNYKSSYIQALISLMLISLLLAVHYLSSTLRVNYLFNDNANFLIFPMVYREGINITIAALSIPFVTYNIRRPISNWKNDSIMSSMSYIIYLIHWPILLVYARFVDRSFSIRKLIILAFTYIIIFTVTYLISLFLDRPFEKRRKKWLKSQIEKKDNLIKT